MKLLFTFLLSLLTAIGLQAANPSFTDMYNAMQWTNSNGTISNRVASTVSNLTFNSSVPLTNPTMHLVSFSNSGTNRLVLTPEATVISDELYVSVGQSNYLAYEPGASDGVTPYTWNTSEFHTTGYLFDFLNKTTNVFSIIPDGGLIVGRNSYFGPATAGTALLSYRNTPVGDVDFAQILLGSVGSAATIYSEIDSELSSTYANVSCKTRNGAADTITTAFMITGQGDSQIGILASGALRTDIHATASDGSAAYTFGTSLYHTSGLLAQIQNFGSNKLSVDFAGNVTASGNVLATNGFASYSTLSTNSVGGSGYTNNQSINQVVYLNGTAVAVTQKDRSGTTIVPATTFTGTMTVVLQPGWAVTAASGLTGTAVPF